MPMEHNLWHWNLVSMDPYTPDCGMSPHLARPTFMCNADLDLGDTMA